MRITPSFTRPGTREMRVLLGVMGIAVAVRVVAALALGDRVVELPGIQDQLSYDTLARRVLARRGFSFPTDRWRLPLLRDQSC